MSTLRSDPTCVACGRSATDMHHVTTRGAGGKNTADNLMPLCRKHHQIWHARGPRHAWETYPGVKKWLEDHNRWDVFERSKRTEEKSGAV